MIELEYRPDARDTTQAQASFYAPPPSYEPPIGTDVEFVEDASMFVISKGAYPFLEPVGIITTNEADALDYVTRMNAIPRNNLEFYSYKKVLVIK